MRLIAYALVSFVACQMMMSCNNAKTTASADSDYNANMETQMDSLSYGLGVLLGTNLKGQGFEDLDFNMVKAGMQAVMAGEEPKISAQDANGLIQEYMTKKADAAMSKNLEEGAAFLTENKAKEGVVTLPSGLQYEVITEGTGPKPAATDKVSVHYHGTLLDGTVFDSSIERGTPASFPVNGVIQGWQEALQLMPVGSKWKLFIPADLAYGERGAGGAIGPNATLIFDVELLSIDN